MPTKPHLDCPSLVARPVVWLAFFGVCGLFVAVTPVAAAPTPTPSTSGYTNILDNLFTVVYNTLRYAGLAALAGGGIIWFVSQSDHRSAWGQRLVIGGVAMTVLYFGFNAFLAVLKWIATNGGS